MAAYIELYVDQGTNFESVITLTDDLTNDAVNVFGYSVRSQMRRSYYSTNASANITCTIFDASKGEIKLSLSANNTANIKAGRYLFDVEATDRSNNISRILEGIITVTPRVTK
jgi:hypothetical protein